VSSAVSGKKSILTRYPDMPKFTHRRRSDCHLSAEFLQINMAKNKKAVPPIRCKGHVKGFVEILMVGLEPLMAYDQQQD